MDFSLNTEQRQAVERVKDFVARIDAAFGPSWPHSDYDITPEVGADIRRQFIEYGFNGLAIPKEVKGRGLGTLVKALVFEELQRSPVLRGHTLTWPWFLDPHPALFNAPEWQREKYLYPVIDGRAQYHICISEPDHGSDAAGIQCRAERQGDHYVLNGLKRWPPDPDHFLTRPDYMLVYAVTDPGKGYKGISTFLVDYPSPGLAVEQVRETQAPGTFLGRVSDLSFTNVRVPAENLLGEENAGFRYVQDQLNRNRTVIAATAVGEAKRVLQIALDYAKERKTFGQPLKDHQGIQFMLAEMAMEIEAVRMIELQAAWKIDHGLDARREAAMGKGMGPRMTCSVIDKAVQILGGIGCLKERSLGEAWAMYKIAQLAEGSVEMMKLTVFRSLLAEGVQ